jgi:hypothetical protein
MGSQIEAIREAGEKAGEAMRHQDTACCRFHSEWARKAIRLEDDKEAAQKAFDEGYKSVSESRYESFL